MGMDPVHCGCGHTIPVKPEWAGKSVRCTMCQAILLVPESIQAELRSVPPPPSFAPSGGASEGKPPLAGSATSELRPCPYCGERIQAAAKKCRYCNEFLDKSAGTSIPAPSGPTTDAGGMGPLVVALVAWIIGCFFLHPVAWFMGSAYEKECRARGVEPSGAGRAGKILGIVGTILMGIALLIFAFVIVGAAVTQR